MSETGTTSQGEKRKDPYRHTLLLPKTSFSMKANLQEVEPRIQRFWERIDLYERLRRRKRGKSFVLHDGPPYANGPIHMGHLLNKVLKDLVVRSKTMAGYGCEFVPGWDCHGLPIEHLVMKEMGAEARDADALRIRRKCESYARKYVKIQSGQMKRLGTMGDYDRPYLTMAPEYEASVLDVFAQLVSRGLVYRALKPVHWSIENRTALADAELEYMERRDMSVYVLFPVVTPELLPFPLRNEDGSSVFLLVWTTTPWTLPANLAVAVGPQGDYAAYECRGGGRRFYVILAEPLAERVLALAGLEEYVKRGSVKGSELAAAGIRYRHPFLPKELPVVAAPFVTFEDGTGLVHIAPGHGEEDYQCALNVGLEIYCPVTENGTFDDTAPEWLRGVLVWDANDKIVARLRESGCLFMEEEITHSYPHDWRSKTPTIFRATRQWFIAVDKPFTDGSRTLRELALEAVERAVEFVPHWGRNRLRGMLEARPDWCISRQRAWGLPIPVFLDPEDRVLLTPSTVATVAAKVAQHGSNVWFKAGASELLEGYDPTSDPDAPEWVLSNPHEAIAGLRKGTDIFDVWFESGSSWNAVLLARGLGFPADMYLEGSDQHRGWFQLSLLPALAAAGTPPFRTVLTHGFMVDASGKKMSKSGGNAIEVDQLLAKYGADVCRWWVSTLNYSNDIKVDWDFFRIASEEYRKVRNTIRFMLGNLNDFDPERDSVPLGRDDRYSIDAWVMREAAGVIRDAVAFYENYQFKRVSELLFSFCNNTLSAVYLAALKDRLYCDPAASRRRRRAQTVLYRLADALIRLIAPIVVHTAEDAYHKLKGIDFEASEESVHLLGFPEPFEVECSEHWDWVMGVREKVLKALEVAKTERGIRNPLDAGVRVITASEEERTTLELHMDDMADLCGVSRFAVEVGEGELHVEVDDLRDEPRCERSWKRDGTVKPRSDGGMLSDRDAAAVGVT